MALLFAGPVFAAGPKPDPPPIQHAPPPPPPPAPQQPPPPPAPQPPPPPPPVVVAPAVARKVEHPTPAEAKAAKRAALRKAARRRATDGTALVREQPPALVAGASGSGSSWVALPIVILAFFLGLVMLGLALTPARAVPWSRVSYALESHRDELGVLGFFGLVAALVFFLLVQVTN